MAGGVVGAIDQGLLVLVGVEPRTPASVEKILHKLLSYVFSDAAGAQDEPVAQR